MLSHMTSHIARLPTYLRMIPRTLLDSFALRLVYRINPYLDSNPHTRLGDDPGSRGSIHKSILSKSWLSTLHSKFIWEILLKLSEPHENSLTLLYAASRQA